MNTERVRPDRLVAVVAAASLLLIGVGCSTTSTASSTSARRDVAPAAPPIATAPPAATATTGAPPTLPVATTVPVATTAPTTAPAAPPSLAPTPTAAPWASAPPEVDAAAYAVYDASTGTWLAERDADTPRAVGSVMKLLTAYVVMQAGDPERVVTVPAMQVDPDESAIGLYAGEQLPRDVLLRAMLIVSANDAARALATDVAGSEEAFVARMNEATAALGLTGTIAANPVGLDAPGAGSTARDVVRLAAVLLQDPTFRATAVRRDASLHGMTFPATNDLLATYPGATGVKSGHTTQAGWCLVGSAQRDGREIIVAVLGASSDAARTASTTALLDWAFAQA